jgi:hypothetical protein
VASWPVGDASLADLVTKAPVIFGDLPRSASKWTMPRRRNLPAPGRQRQSDAKGLSVHSTFMRPGLGSCFTKNSRDRTMWRVLKAVAVAALTAAIFGAAGQAGEPGCVEWSKAGPVIAQNSLVAANVVYQAVQKRTGGKVVNQVLCNAGGRYVYKLVVLGPTGEVSNVIVDAKTGKF